MRAPIATLVSLLLLALCACGPVSSGDTASPPTTPTAPGTRTRPVRGCTPTAHNDDVTAVGFVVGNRSNTQLAGTAVQSCYVTDLLNRPSHLLVAVSDGTPTAVFDQRVPDLPSGRKRTETYQRIAQELGAALATPADAAEADVLEAVARVSAGMRDDTGLRRIVIDDNLLQTTGALPLQNGYLYADPADVVEQLRPYLDTTMPNLNGYEIILLSPGAAASPQPEPTAEVRARLITLWTAVFQSTGAKVTVDPGTTFADPPAVAAERPKVTVVPFDPPTPPAPPTRPTAAATPAATCSERLGSDRVAFVSDTADFLDPARARQVIADVARRIAGCAGTVTLTGTTSSAGTEAGRRRVSTDRAHAVRAVLAADLGVDPTTIRAVGVGMRFPGFVSDRKSDGALDAIKARANRLVIIEVRPT